MAPYRRFASAIHQTCLAHLLRRCRELLDDAQRGQAKTPRAVRRILQAALAARAARDADQLDAAQVQAEAERLGAAVDRLLAGQTIYPPNRRLLDHLGRERDALFTFLAQPVDATGAAFHAAVGDQRPPPARRARHRRAITCWSTSPSSQPPTGPTTKPANAIPPGLVDMARGRLTACGESLRLIPGWHGLFGVEMAARSCSQASAQLAPTSFQTGSFWLGCALRAV